MPPPVTKAEFRFTITLSFCSEILITSAPEGISVYTPNCFSSPFGPRIKEVTANLIFEPSTSLL